MLKILVNNQSLELAQETIKYTKQCNDISDLSSRETNYTDSFSIPKTPNNIQIFEGLGLNNDVSQIPYSKNTAQILDNGMPLVKEGWLDVKETTNEFKINIYDGLIDLFKAIENKTFGDDIDLSEINHEKNLTTIVNSFTNEDYRYILNDFGGKTHTDLGTKINIDYLVPSVRVKYLWNKIFSTFGFNYLGEVFNTQDFEQLWLTYPKGIPTDLLTTLYAEFLDWDGNIFNNINIIQGTNFNNTSYIVPSTGTYNISFNGLVNYDLPNLSTQNDGIYLTVNGVFFAYSLFNTNININLNVGDEITLNKNIPFNSYNFIEGFFIVNKYENPISFTEELKQLRITDFFKEIVNRFALTIFINKDGIYIFKTFDERLQSGIIDWSEKYHSRFSETYTVKSYAQQNIFRQEYQDDRNDYNDGSFLITNKNLPDTKDVIKSKIFSAEKDFVSFRINGIENEIVTPTLLWDKEVSENNGIQEVKYKPLSKRFYFLRSETITKNAVLKSETLGLYQSVTSLPIARFNITAFKDFVPKYYGNIELLLNDFRLHKIKLALNTIDFINLDFDKIYYFKQEQNYYFLNKITFEKGKLSNAEFYRVKALEYTDLKRHYSNQHYADIHYSNNLI